MGCGDDEILEKYIESIKLSNKQRMEEMCGKDITSQTIMNGYIIEYKVLYKAPEGLYVGKGTRKRGK